MLTCAHRRSSAAAAQAVPASDEIVVYPIGSLPRITIWRGAGESSDFLLELRLQPRTSPQTFAVRNKPKQAEHSQCSVVWQTWFSFSASAVPYHRAAFD